MSSGPDKSDKKKIMKDIILKLHQGLSVEAARERFEKEVGNVTSTEIAQIEQGLIDDGLSPEEIKKFCNVHALIFQSALEKAAANEFWINYRGRFVHIRYFAVRDKGGQYLGTLEVTQDIGPIKKLEGERRLLDERD